MKKNHKYYTGEIVSFAGRLYKVVSYKNSGFNWAGIEYELEALKPDKKTGYFEKCFGIPEGFIVKK